MLDLLGWKLRRDKQRLAIESNEKDASGKQDLSSALEIDQGAMQSAFQSGGSFRFEIRWERALLGVDDATLRQLVSYDKLNGGLPEALLELPDLARFYTGMSNLDRETSAAMTNSFNTVVLASRLSRLLSRFTLRRLRSAVEEFFTPGGPAADPVWSALAGVTPTQPIPFLRALFEKDNGKLLAFFNALSELDWAHQRFFTRSVMRATSFYWLFAESEEVRSGVAKLGRTGSFAEFLRDIPLNDDGSVDFPGGAQVWMVAKGNSKTADKSQQLLAKAQKAVAPDVEDNILLRIASTRYKVGVTPGAELDNFLAVAHIDSHRSDPLDGESALLLAQNLAAYGSFFPYFSGFTDLTSADFRNVFALGAKLTSLDALDAELAMGQFFAVVELIHLGVESGRTTEQQATVIFRSAGARFLAARNAAEFTMASLDSVREMIGASTIDPDQALAAMVLGDAISVDLEWKDIPHHLDPGRRRAVAFGRVLNLQKTPAVAPLVRMEDSLRAIASGKGPIAPPIAQLIKDAASLPVAEIPKSEQLTGKPKQAIDVTTRRSYRLLPRSCSRKPWRKRTSPEIWRILQGIS